MMDDQTLLRRYAREHSEQAFTELVSPRLPLVYSAALRQLGGDHHLASEVAQLVFGDLARKAASLATHRELLGWLYTSTRFAAGKVRRSEARRKSREQIAAAMHILNADQTTNSRDWELLAPVLDDVIDQLSPEDRQAVLLRFFSNMSLGEVGAELGTSPDAARVRVTRALQKLQGLLSARGVTFSGATLAALLVANAVQAAPVGLAGAVAATALASATASVGFAERLFETARAYGKLVACLGAVAAILLAGRSVYVKTRLPNASGGLPISYQNVPASRISGQAQYAGASLLPPRDTKGPARNPALLPSAAPQNPPPDSTGIVNESTSTVQDLQTRTSRRLTADNRQVGLSLAVRWHVAEPATYSLRSPGESAGAPARQLEDILSQAEANTIGLYNLEDVLGQNEAQLRRMEQQLQSNAQAELDKTRCGIRILSLHIHNAAPL